MDVHVYQIVYSAASGEICDPGFQQLDNLGNERPDWREYWPIRNYLKSRDPLDEEAFYGFLSPKFGRKTGLASHTVIDFIKGNEKGRDVFLFSPYFEQLAFFRNVFEQAEANHPGLTELTAEFLRRCGEEADLSGMISCSRNAVFSNYIVARPSFWRRWFTITETLFRMAEDPNDPLYGKLNATAPYREADAQYKVFIVERIACYVLARCELSAIKAFPLVHRVSDQAFSHQFFTELVVMDAMKYCHLESRHPAYLQIFEIIRRDVEARLA